MSDPVLNGIGLIPAPQTLGGSVNDALPSGLGDALNPCPPGPPGPQGPPGSSGGSGSGSPYISLTPDGLYVSGSVRTVSGQLRQADGSAWALESDVIVDTFAQGASRGEITTVTGFEIMNTGTPTGKLSSVAITSLADGTFSFTVTNAAAGSTFVTVRATFDGGLVAVLTLQFVNGG